MKLISLELENFQGIKHLKIEPEGQDIKIFGENGTGKTTAYNSFLWLMFNKDSHNRTDFQIKTLTPEGAQIHNLNHSVEAVLSLESGKNITLKKSYYETWTKKRGNSKPEHTGHTTDYFIDGVPSKLKEYNEKVREIMDEELFKLITSPSYFNTVMKWQDRRRLLLEICGDIEDQEVIDSNKKLKDLPEILGDRSLEEHRKVIAAKKKEINKELERLPVRIDEINHNLPDVTTYNRAAIEDKIKKLNENLSTLQDEISRLESGDTSDLKAQIRELEAKREEIKQAYIKDENQKYNDLQSKISTTKKELMEVETLREQKVNRKNHLVKECEKLAGEIDLLRQQWKEINSNKFEYDGSNSCPTCGQEIPEKEMEEAKERALKYFNTVKAEKLKNINESGKEKKKMMDEYNDEIKRLEEKNSNLYDSETSLTLKLDDLREICTNRQQDGYLQDKGYLQVDKDIKSLKTDINSRQDTLQEKTKDKQDEMAKIKESIQEETSKIHKLDQHNAASERLSHLESEEKKLAEEHEKMEHQLFLTEEFIRTKVGALEDKINNKFKMAKFKLFETQQNGGIAETCETLYNGVPYSSGLNNAARINVGLDIIRTLSEHYGISAPIFVDNAESVTELIEMPCQMISLIVSEKDKELRIEKGDK